MPSLVNKLLPGIPTYLLRVTTLPDVGFYLTTGNGTISTYLQFILKNSGTPLPKTIDIAYCLDFERFCLSFVIIGLI